MPNEKTPADTTLIPLPGSERHPLPSARKLGAAAADATLQVTILLRRKPGSTTLAPMATALGQAAPGSRDHLTPEAFATLFGADPADFEQVEAFAHAHGLDVIERKPTERRLLLAGSVANVCTAFGVALDEYVDAAGTTRFRGRSGPVHIPASLAAIVEGVFGLDDRPQACTHFRMRPLPEPAGASGPAVMARETMASYTPPQLAAAYDFPTAGQGQGQCIAIIELGGGYRMADLDAYFKRLGIATPTIRSKSVDGARNRPSGDANSADGEVLLDIEVVGAIAPGARIVVYFAPNTDAGFLNAISTAIHDPVNRPSVVSISWGGPESTWTLQAMRGMDSVFQDAAALGVTICCAAGDDGSSDIRAPQSADSVLHADFPASSPYCLACGGTRLQGAGATRSETVWNAGRGGGATGGGISDVFALPAWQQAAGVPPSANPGHHVGRGLPDVAANADPATGYQIQVDGQQMVIGGTSAVAPLYAAFVALCNEQLGRRVGYLNPLLYALPASAAAFRDIRSGDNDISGRHGAYASGAGWDPCTGLGSVQGTRLLAALGAVQRGAQDDPAGGPTGGAAGGS